MGSRRRSSAANYQLMRQIRCRDWRGSCRIFQEWNFALEDFGDCFVEVATGTLKGKAGFSPGLRPVRNDAAWPTHWSGVRRTDGRINAPALSLHGKWRG